MMHLLVQLPIWLWLLLLGFVEITVIYPLMGYSYVEIGSIIPVTFLFSYSIHI